MLYLTAGLLGFLAAMQGRKYKWTPLKMYCMCLVYVVVLNVMLEVFTYATAGWRGID